MYLICDAERELFKIGITKGSVDKRLKELQTGNGGELHVVYSFETDKPYRMETMLHHLYQNGRKSGEWFEMDEESVLSFTKRCEECQKRMDALKENPFF